MQIKKESTHLGEIVIVAPEVFEDERGFFMETYRADQFKALGLPTDFVQYNTTGTYNGQTDVAIRFDDPDIGIQWPISDPQISERDKKAIAFAQWLQSPASDRFHYEHIQEGNRGSQSYTAARP